jgi:uncharacterized membrane protein HdeD (DUF308 family)
MANEVAINWWALAIRGVVGILIGIAAFVWTGITLAVLIALLAAYLFIDGVFAIIAGARGRSWLLGLEGFAGIVAAVLVFRWPAITALILVYLVAAWAIITGILELGGAFMLRQIVRNEWLLALGGVVSVVFGIALVFNPSAGLLTLVYLFGAYMILFGALTLALALRLRGARATLVVGT